MSSHPIIVLWTTPRSRSTAFERMMIARGDHTVLDEPFSARYYFSDERRSRRFDATLPGSDTESIVDQLTEAAEHQPVFVKEMAYHTTGLIDADLLARFTNTFLIRQPVAAVASFAAKWPDLTEEEAGFGRLGEVFATAQALAASTPAVIDADELATDPASTVQAWSRAVGIEFLPESLHWEPGMVEQWKLWRDWYEGAAASTGFEPPRPSLTALDDPRLEAIVDRCWPIYHELHARRLRP